MELENDEFAVLEMPEDEVIASGWFGHDKLLLTNKRLIFLKKKESIRLEEIQRVYRDTASMGITKMKIVLKNQKIRDVKFQVYGVGVSLKGASYLFLKQEMITDKWVNAINSQKQKSK